MNHTIGAFTKGVHNILNPELIPVDAAQDSTGWLTKEGKIILAHGRSLVGQDANNSGRIDGVHFGYKVDGSTVMYRKIGTKVQYLSGSTWTDVITGLTANSDYSFTNYSSLSGAYTFVSGVDGIWKIVNSHPTNPLAMYNSAKNFKGKMFIDRGRSILWGREKDKTGLYGSWIDRQDSTVYTSISNENWGASGSTHYTGTAAAASSTRNLFAFNITGTTAAGVETFTDNYMGTLTSDKGGTGTINYVTGAYVLDFNGTVTSGSVEADYQWEDSNIKGVTDFTKSATRVAGEGFRFPQDIGGDAILNVLVGQDGSYYSLKERSAYKLTIDNTDLAATNQVYRASIGIPTYRAGISSNKGIVFMNTANPTKPEMTILQQNVVTANVEPVTLFPHFKFANYNYDDCAIDVWERYVMVACRTEFATWNDTLLLCDLSAGTVDVTNYGARCFAQNEGLLYVGSPLVENVYKLFTGFDDDGLPITNYWVSKTDAYDGRLAERLKKFRRLKIKGLIDPDQALEIYGDVDGTGYTLLGTIVGSGDYVDYAAPQAIGHTIGESQIGGEDSTTTAYPFMTEVRVSLPYFRTRTLKLMATGVGYLEVQLLSDWDVIPGVDRIPARFRQKQHVSLDGLTTDEATG